jgi:hypothetical protein
MGRTAFPTKPADVVALTSREFSFDVEMSEAPTLDFVCARFVDDVNRALVYLIRFRALKEWRARANVTDWLSDGSRTSRDVCEVAARFALNDQWQFDPDGFCTAVDAVVSERSRLPRA